MARERVALAAQAGKELALMERVGQRWRVESKVELDAAMAEMDEDGSGGIDFSEFYQWWCSDTPKKGIPVACECSAATAA